MNQQLQETCELFIANKEALEKKFKWESSYIMPASSMLYTEKKASVDIEKLTQCKDMIKKSTSVFSNFQGDTRLVLMSKMALADNPKEYLDKVMKIYDLLKKHKISGSEYTVIAATAIADYDGTANIDEIIEKIAALFATMKKNHPFLTSSEDITFTALLAMSGLPEEKVLQEMEACYNALKPNFSSANAVQSLSHVLALDERDTDTKCKAVMEMYDLLKKNGKKFDSSAISILGGLILLDIDKETIISEIMEADAFLKKQKGFGVMGIGEKQRLLYAATLVMNQYASNQEHAQTTMLTSSISVMIAEQMAMLAAIAAVAAASSTSN